MSPASDRAAPILPLAHDALVAQLRTMIGDDPHATTVLLLANAVTGVLPAATLAAAAIGAALAVARDRQIGSLMARPSPLGP